MAVSVDVCLTSGKRVSVEVESDASVESLKQRQAANLFRRGVFGWSDNCPRSEHPEQRSTNPVETEDNVNSRPTLQCKRNPTPSSVGSEDLSPEPDTQNTAQPSAQK